MNSRYLFTITLLIILPYVIGRCSSTWRKKVEKIICTDINQDGYLTNLFEIRTNLTDVMGEKNITRLSIIIANSYFPTIDDWIYLPWDDLLESISTLKIVNSSVNSIRSLYRFPSLDTLDLSGNNITDFNFLFKLKKLKNLHLRQSEFSEDNSLFRYIQRYQHKLKLIDLSYGNLHKFYLQFDNIEKYDLSENPSLESIIFNQSSPLRYLNLSGNTQLNNFTNKGNSDFLCVFSINLSHLNNNFSFSLLENIRVLDEILLNNNNIPVLNESIFALTNLLSKKCSAGSGISIDLSNVNLESISSNYFSSHVLGTVNLNNNNLSNLEGSIFSRSEFFVLDISNSNVSKIGSNVFNYVTVILLNLSKNNITSLEGVFDNIETIKELDLSFNPIETLSENTFKKCQNLEILNLANTFVQVFGENALSNLPSLEKMTLSFSGTVNRSSIRNIYLNELTICNSTLTNLEPENFKGFYKLSKFDFLNSSVSNISSKAFKGINMIKTLNLKGLSKSSKDISIFKYLPHLLHLDLSDYNIKNIGSDFENLYSLQSLNLSSNIISDLSVSSFVSLKKLEVLSLAHNQLLNIAVGTFSPLKKLTHLYLNNNALQKLLPGVFSGLDSLTLLDISQNQLLRSKPHILFSSTLTNVKHLYLQNNNLGNEYAVNDNTLRRYEFDLISNQASLEYIDINNNEWSCSTLIDILTSFRNKNITYRPTKPVYTQANINGVLCTP